MNIIYMDSLKFEFRKYRHAYFEITLHLSYINILIRIKASFYFIYFFFQIKYMHIKIFVSFNFKLNYIN